MNITALEFFQPTLAHRRNLNLQFLDVGCGTGDFTRTELLSRCQPCQRIVATDTILKMIEYAQKHFAHPQIAYEEHDIRGDVSGLIAKYGQFDRVYSFYTLNWVQDQTTALRNIRNLMKDDGDCVLVFAARTAVRKIWKRLVEMDRWKQYDQPSKRFIAKTQDLEDREALMSYMYETLKNANLNPLSCEVLTSVHSAEVSDRTIGSAPTHALEHTRTYTHTLQRRTGFSIRRRGTLDLDKPRQESVTKGPLSARETLTLKEMIPSLRGVVAQERICGIIRKWRQTKTRTERTRPEVPPPASSPGILSRQCCWFLDRLTPTSGQRDYSQREKLSSALLPGVAASTRRRAMCSAQNGSDSRSPTFKGKAKPHRVDKKGRRRKDVALAKAYRNTVQSTTAKAQSWLQLAQAKRGSSEAAMIAQFLPDLVNSREARE
ncbi:hypothetical protein HPB47_005359 [Ixodes persulcatus]|uniref:Uncharacterized protein n=1 Tax=Ixodes persulcatus TaxID=34615 RepID=A0AC60PDW2_IXOPE|nr:hypothetical protein HPB47_005359 [Ixodes persulcatus]